MTREPNPEFLRRTIALATENVTSGRGGPFGALIARDGKIVAEGVNLVTVINDPTAHGEVTAIRAACKALGTFSLTGCELYTSCEPCPMCLAAAHWARLDAVYFGASAADAAKAGFDDAYLYDEFRKDAADRSLPATQLLRDEAWSSFAAWIASPSKVDY
jgi:tRNA(Arg) A34 adenosine deaminase TadA